MSRKIDSLIKELKEDESHITNLGRGRGSLMVRLRGKSYSGIYRYWIGKQRVYIHIGAFKSSNKVSGFTYTELKDKAIELSILRQKIAPIDLKEYLDGQEQKRQDEKKEEARQQAIREAQGSFRDLLESYIKSLERRGSVDSRNIHNIFKCYCLKPFPRLAEKKAKDITPDDIVVIIARMIGSGITTTSNRVRSYLMAAFNHGLKADHDPRQQAGQAKRFYLQYNPVAAIPKQTDYENVRDRRLSDDEIRDLWYSVDQCGSTANPIYWLLLRFCFACYGNRPMQLARCRWEDVDFEGRSLLFIERKGRSGRPRKRIIPLSQLAIDILTEVRRHTPSTELIFSLKGEKPLSISRIGNEVQRLYQWQVREAERKGLPVPSKWTSKDIRRTATSLLTRLQIGQEHRYLLQSRENGSVESRHYDHDDRLPEKRLAAARYDNLLREIIDGNAPPKVVNLDYYRS